MENKNLNVKNEKVVNVESEKKVINLKKINLDVNQLVYEDEELARISVKSFDSMTEEELMKLPLCKAKVVPVERVDRKGKKQVYYKAMFMLCEGISKEKTLSEKEVLAIQNFNPELITDGLSKVWIPVKLVSFTKKDGSGRAFNYTACLSPSVYMGTTKSVEGKKNNDSGYLDTTTLNNIIANNLQYKTNKARQVMFVNVPQEMYESNKQQIMDYSDFESYDSF